MDDFALAWRAAAAATLCIPGRANDPGGRPLSPGKPGFWALWAALAAAGLGTGLFTNSDPAALAPCRGKFGNTGEGVSLWSIEEPVLLPPVWLGDKADRGTPKVEVVALLVACSVKSNFF